MTRRAQWILLLIIAHVLGFIVWGVCRLQDSGYEVDVGGLGMTWEELCWLAEAPLNDGYYATVQEAVDAASPGDTVWVTGAGCFIERGAAETEGGVRDEVSVLWSQRGNGELSRPPTMSRVRNLAGQHQGMQGLRGNGQSVPSLVRLVRQIARAEGLDEDLACAVVEVESGWNPRAVSSAGAQGLFQLMPCILDAYGVTDPFNPRENARAGIMHLKVLTSRHGLEAGLTRYNRGPTSARSSGYARRVMRRMGEGE